MSQLVKAIYEHGTFIPESPCNLREGTSVLLTIHDACKVAPPEVTDPEEQARMLRSVIERMKRNALPPGAPRFSRHEMHERG